MGFINRLKRSQAEAEADRLRAWMTAIADLKSHTEPSYRMAQRALSGEPAPAPKTDT